jgi:hypothetical protein
VIGSSRSKLVIASIYREWMVNIGHRSTPIRIVHLFCEMMVARQESAGPAEGDCADLPLTQSHRSAATGLSAVHVLRRLQDLHKRELVVFGNGPLAIPDREALARAANFSEGSCCLPLSGSRVRPRRCRRRLGPGPST